MRMFCFLSTFWRPFEHHLDGLKIGEPPKQESDRE